MSDAPRTDLSGRKIGEYEITARIGVGGMGEVYEGRQPLIGKRVAVKVLLPSLSNEKELVERFLSEARAVNEIRHRGIVDIFSFGQLEGGSHYFVMEFLEGQAFDRILKQRGPLPIGEALSYIEEVLDALESAHAAGIVHRDIKPSNIFLVNTGRGKPYVKLLDFGIAKLGALANGSDSAPQTRASMILGTPDYISPEQARGKPISAATDLYALGVVLFEMVTGFRPFRGENTLQTMWMHVEDQPPVPSTIRADIPQALDELILWAMEKDPAARPASAEEMRAHLDAVRASLLPGTGSTTPAPITGRNQPVTTATPSGRQRALSSTPAPRSGSQKALSQGSTSGNRSRAGLRPSGTPGAAPSAETRMAPLTTDEHVQLQPGNQTRVDVVPNDLIKTDPERNAVPRSTEPALEAVLDDAPLEPPKSKLPLVIGLASLVLILGGGIVLFASGGGTSETTVTRPVDVKPPEPTRPPDVKPPEPTKPADVKPPEPTKPADVKPPEPTKPADVKPPEPTKPADVKPPEPTKPVDVKPPEPVATKKSPPAKGVTQQQLDARLARIEAKLKKHEDEMGDADPMLRRLLGAAKAAVKSSTDEASRKDAWQQLAEVEGQLR
ncbi:MAG: protein kinase [Myxococcaceae bacterium]|nr:protein kinase [Myxococcaceae bacterium]